MPQFAPKLSAPFDRSVDDGIGLVRLHRPDDIPPIINAARHELNELNSVGNRLEPLRRLGAMLPNIKVDDLVTTLRQQAQDVAADETRPTGDKNGATHNDFYTVSIRAMA